MREADSIASEKIAVAFRFGVGQAGKLRAFDDLRRRHFNLHCTVCAPIKLPTRDHISQMCLDIKPPDRKWAFSKADHEEAYKQLPLAHSRKCIALVSTRKPVAFERMAFHPNALLFGDLASVLNYNCFPRLLSALFDLIIGIPLIGYFGHFGARIPYGLSNDSLGAFAEFFTTLGIRLKTKRQRSGAG